MSLTLTGHDEHILRTAAYGAITLLSATGAAHNIATPGTVALSSATGPIGHVLAAKTNDIKLTGRSVADLADTVLPALTDSMTLLKQQDPAEADNFRNTVIAAIESATQGRPGPTLADMTRKITAALDAA